MFRRSRHLAHTCLHTVSARLRALTPRAPIGCDTVYCAVTFAASSAFFRWQAQATVSCLLNYRALTCLSAPAAAFHRTRAPRTKRALDAVHRASVVVAVAVLTE